VVRVSQMLDEGTQRDEHSALAKSYTTSRMRETVAWCREIFGGNGITLEYDVARFFADAEAIYSYEGTQEMNTLIVGRSITGKAAFV
jgi:glutaryl-CoA dehydrogenase